MNFQKLLKNFDRDALKKYLSNTVWLAAEKVLRLVLAMVVGLWVARYLGKERFGQLNYVLSYVFLFTSISALGLTELLAREFLKRPEKQLLSTTFYIKLASGAFFFILANVLALCWKHDSTELLLILIVSLSTPFAAFDVVTYYFQAKVKSKVVVKVQLGVLLATSVLKLLFVYYECSIVYFAVASMLDWALSNFCLYFIFRKLGLSIAWRDIDWQLCKELSLQAWPLALNGVAIAFAARLDQLLLKHLLGDSANGIYSAAIQISEKWLFVPMIIGASVFPALIHARQDAPERYKKRVQQLSDFFVVLGVTAGIGASLLSEQAIDILYGSGYSGAGAVLSIHIWCGVFASLNAVNGRWLLAENLVKFILIRSFVGFFCTLVGHFLLIPNYGVLGAAWSVLAAQSVASYFVFAFFKETRPLFWIETKSLFGISLIQEAWKFLAHKKA
ncbi:MAG: flippase [Cytophagales bacterium]|nr:MAG: flippase [Cytophagales bacterium]TAF61946.1 MAG: flippase [Cytophagales bacterium]